MNMHIKPILCTYILSIYSFLVRDTAVSILEGIRKNVEENKEYKILLHGEKGVGKSAILSYLAAGIIESSANAAMGDFKKGMYVCMYTCIQTSIHITYIKYMYTYVTYIHCIHQIAHIFVSSMYSYTLIYSHIY